MLIGEYSYSLDDKKRLSVPAKLRRAIGSKAVLTRGLDSCLVLYPMPEWEKLNNQLGQLSVGQGSTRSFVRLLLSGAMEVVLDSTGRVLVPDYLKDYAKLDKQVVMVGIGNRLEVWDKVIWEQYKNEAERTVGNVAEKLGEMGLY